MSTLNSCYEMKSCEECVNKTSWWLNSSCRWCRRDSKCHAIGSATNPCSEAENLHRNVKNWQEMCSSTPLFPSDYEYDVEYSYTALAVSAAAYHWPSSCITFLLPKSHFYVTKQYEKLCNWFLTTNFCAGFIAISEPGKTIVVAFRGSTNPGQVFSQFAETISTPKTVFLEKGQVESYYKTAFDTLWSSGLHKDFRQMRSFYPDYKVLITGHSLGGALASLASLWMVYYNLVPTEQLILYTFGMPRVGDLEYALIHDRYVRNSMRVVHTLDLVPQFPCRIAFGVGVASRPPCHHATLVSYKNTTNVKDRSAFKISRNLPYNEQLNCELKPVDLLHLEHHTHYFSIDVGGHCIKHHDKVINYYE